MYPLDKLERLQDGDGHVEGCPVQNAEGNVVKYNIGEGQKCLVPNLHLITEISLKKNAAVEGL